MQMVDGGRFESVVARLAHGGALAIIAQWLLAYAILPAWRDKDPAAMLFVPVHFVTLPISYVVCLVLFILVVIKAPSRPAMRVFYAAAAMLVMLLFVAFFVDTTWALRLLGVHFQ